MSRAPILAVVVPCYNEQEVLEETCSRLGKILSGLIGTGEIDGASRVWLVDDGSRDGTWSIIERHASAPLSSFRGIKLSRNQGHQIALLAGLMSAEGDALISLDADLQDDPALIPQMLRRFNAGDDIVYGVRSSRASDSRFKRATATAYYRLLRRLGVEIVHDHADYRLMSRRAVEALRKFGEGNIFLRGLIPQLGFPSSTVSYIRGERFAGQSKYPLGRMLGLAWQGITSFTAAPLRAITALGIGVSVVSLGLGVWALGVRLLSDEAVPGWASIVIPMFLISGVQLLSLGMIGEYLAKVFVETKRRPLYFIDRVAPQLPIEDAIGVDDSAGRRSSAP